MGSNKYDAVVFDLHGTLVPWCRDGFRAMLLKMADAVGAPGDDFTRVMNETAHESMAGGFGSIAAEVEHICRLLNVSVGAKTAEQAARLWYDFHRECYENPYPGAFDLLQQLKANGVKLGLITNCGLEAPELWTGSRFAPLVDAAVFSVTEGILKPDSRIYSRACERLGVTPGRCLYVDDSAACVGGAEDVGMATLLIRHPGNQVGIKDAAEWTGAQVSCLNEVLGLGAG